MGINQRVSLRKFIDDIRGWVDDGKSDEWIASALGTSPSSVQSFRSRNSIYRRDPNAVLYGPQDFSLVEGVLDFSEDGWGMWFDPAIQDDPKWKHRWSKVNKVEVHITPTKIVLIHPESRKV